MIRAADTFVTDAAVDAIQGADAIGLPSPRELLGVAMKTALHSRGVVRRGARLGAESAKIAVGRSAMQPDPKDWRFKDPAWQDNAAFHRIMQLYLAAAAECEQFVKDADLEWRDAERADFLMSLVVSALAPTNALAGNPPAIKRAFETGGRSLARGARNFVRDVRHNGGLPLQVDRTAFTVGEHLAATPGAVVYRDEICEVLQYAPTTPEVRSRPVVLVPPQIGRYYFMDLRPKRSFVEYAVSRGIAVFMISWRNPGPEQRAWHMDLYAAAVLRAIDVARDIFKSDDVNLLSFCAGGILTTTVLSHLAAGSDERVHSASFGVTLLDFDVPATIGAFDSGAVLGLARARSNRDGLITGRSLGALFALLRPNELVWNYFVNNYLLGNDPPVFDILAWNADSTNLSARLHGEFMDIFTRNALAVPGSMEVLGTPVDLGRIQVETYVTGATTDHLTPWKGCYRTTELLGGPSTFILSNAGHIASLVNPPGNPKAHYFAGPDPLPDADEWLAKAERHQGTWWDHWAGWVTDRAGEERRAPTKLGSRRHTALEPAPGLYVRDLTPERMSEAGRRVWAPAEEDRAAANVTEFLGRLAREDGVDLDGYDELWRWSVDELESFWQAVWRFYGLRSPTPYVTVLDERSMPGARWFEGAQVNYAQEVLARASATAPALISVAEDGVSRETSREELSGAVGALAAALSARGVVRGDRVAAYLPNIPEAVVALLAVTSLGAIWTACAPDFGTTSVIDRFSQAEPKVLIAVDGYRFNAADHDRRAVVAELQAALPSLEATILVRSLEPAAAAPPALDVLLYDELTAVPQGPVFEPVPFAHPLWILFSSGTTGLPKGIVHSHGGILLEHLKSLGLCLDLHEGDRYFFHSSTSWMAWNLLVGGLLHGATIVLYDGSPTRPTIQRLWDVAAHTRASVLGIGSAYASGCAKAAVRLPTDGRLSTLRVVIPTGSPLPPAAWTWLVDQLPPRARIDPICGGTDVCTAFFGGSPLLDVHAGEISGRWLGVHAQAFDGDGRPVSDTVGEFVVTAPMPSMPVGLWNDPDGERFRRSYFETFPGVWRQGDWITISGGGGVVVWGRSDATLNRGGVRLGSAEIYAVVEALPEVADSLVVGVELPDGEYSMPLFVVPAPGGRIDDALRATIVAALKRELSPRHVPDEIIEAPAIPRTLTGKKLEVPIKRILQGVAPETAAAPGSLDRPDVMAWYAKHARASLGAEA